MTIRSALAQALEDGLAAASQPYQVVGYPRGFDALPMRTVALWASDLEVLPSAPAGRYRVTYTIQLFTPHQDPARADDDLDEGMGDLLAVLWALPGYVLERAVRTVSEDQTIHSWTLTVAAGVVVARTPEPEPEASS